MTPIQSLPISTVLRTYYPCHATRRVRLLASNYTPFEKYERICPHCSQHWNITRTRWPERGQHRYDLLDWERTP
jgi:hypothetical protein